MFWQPVYRAQDLPPGRAFPIEIMNEHFTLYRGEGGAPHCVSFRCAHRGTQLSTGWVERDNIRCRYHGWMYDGTGQCVEQPGELKSFASKVQIRSYPTQEYLGLIFAYFGEGEAPPMQRHPEFEGPGILEWEQPEYWPCNYFNRIDNSCDSAHVLYTHYEARRREGRNTSTRGVNYFSRPSLNEETAYGIRSLSGDRQHGGFSFHMPNANQDSERQALVRRGILNPSNDSFATRLRWRVPVNDEKTVTLSVTVIRLTKEEEELARKNREQYERFLVTYEQTAIAANILAGNMAIEDVSPDAGHANMFSVEDYVVQVGQGPISRLAPERLGTIDKGLILLRKIWERELRALHEGRPLKQWGIKE